MAMAHVNYFPSVQYFYVYLSAEKIFIQKSFLTGYTFFDFIIWRHFISCVFNLFTYVCDKQYYRLCLFNLVSCECATISLLIGLPSS